MRWPWNRVNGFKVESLANGNMLVTPDWIDKWKGEDLGGGPGLISRLDMAHWIEERLKKRASSSGGDKQP